MPIAALDHFLGELFLGHFVPSTMVTFQNRLSHSSSTCFFDSCPPGLKFGRVRQRVNAPARLSLDVLADIRQSDRLHFARHRRSPVRRDCRLWAGLPPAHRLQSTACDLEDRGAARHRDCAPPFAGLLLACLTQAATRGLRLNFVPTALVAQGKRCLLRHGITPTVRASHAAGLPIMCEARPSHMIGNPAACDARTPVGVIPCRSKQRFP